MPEAYTRQSSFSNGDVIDAPLFNAEFDQLEEAFKADVGHSHDGTAGVGAPIPFIQKGTTGVYVDTTVPLEPKIVFKIGNVVVQTMDATYNLVTDKIKHIPVSTGIPVALNAYLEGLEVAVGDAAESAASAAESADRGRSCCNGRWCSCGTR